MGIQVRDIDGIMVYQHNGYWGTRIAYVPNLRIAAAATMSQTERRAEILDSMLRKVLAALSATETTAYFTPPSASDMILLARQPCGSDEGCLGQLIPASAFRNNNALPGSGPRSVQCA